MWSLSVQLVRKSKWRKTYARLTVIFWSQIISDTILSGKTLNNTNKLKLNSEIISQDGSKKLN